MELIMKITSRFCFFFFLMFASTQVFALSVNNCTPVNFSGTYNSTYLCTNYYPETDTCYAVSCSGLKTTKDCGQYTTKDDCEKYYQTNYGKSYDCYNALNEQDCCAALGTWKQAKDTTSCTCPDIVNARCLWIESNQNYGECIAIGSPCKS